MPVSFRSAATSAVRPVCLLALLLSLAACAGTAPRDPVAVAAVPAYAEPAAQPRASARPGPSAEPPTSAQPRIAAPDSLLLVSVDGLHPDRINDADAPNIARLARAGVRARWMTPAYPTLTFPNHYTIVTGLRPDRHGIVHNSMHDPELGNFRLSDADAVGASAWWGGEPIWVGAENAGLPTATMFWPGSEARIAGVRPTRWHVYDESVPEHARAATVAGWLLEPAATRPRLATLYFHSLDGAAHAYGPDSTEAREALAAIDDALGTLIEALERGGRLDRTNLVLVSDHGMAPVPPDQLVSIDDMVDGAQARVHSVGQVVQVEPLPGHEAAVEARLLGRHARYECWHRDRLPARWRYGTHPRIAPIVCQMDEGWDAVTPRMRRHRADAGTRGSHGYDPALPSMRAVFIAHGPAFRRGAVIEPVESVDVYPLLAQLLGIPPADHDGDPDALRPALVAPLD